MIYISCLIVGFCAGIYAYGKGYRAQSPFYNVGVDYRGQGIYFKAAK